MQYLNQIDLLIKPNMENIWEHHYQKWVADNMDVPNIERLKVQLEAHRVANGHLWVKEKRLSLIRKYLPFLESEDYATLGSAGFDIPLQYDVTFLPHQPVFIDLGFATAFDPNYVALIFPRSGKGSKEGWHPRNLITVMDSDYRGNWGLTLQTDDKGQLQILGDDGQFLITTTAESNSARIDQSANAVATNSDFTVTLERGSCPVQCVLVPKVIARKRYLTDDEELPESSRGTGGHGHSGK